MLTANASVLEVTWTTLAGLGAGVALAFLAHIWLSYRAVMAWIRAERIFRWGPRHKFVVGFLVGVILLLLIWLGFCALGVNAVLNPPPITPDREAASARGGWILVGLEALLFVFQSVLLGAWVSVGRPSLHTPEEPTTLADLLLIATGAGREMGHVIANDMSVPVAVLDEISRDPGISQARRDEARLALERLQSITQQVGLLHAQIKRLEMRP